MPERRRSKRVPAKLKAWCEGDEFTLLAETINVSKSGLFVRTSSPAPAQGRFKLSIDELGTVAQVEVRWYRTVGDQQRAGMGLKIVGFEVGGGAFEHYVDQVRTPSGQFRMTQPLSGGSDGQESYDDDPPEGEDPG